KPDEYHFRIDAHLFNGACVVVTRQDEVLMHLWIQPLRRVQEFLEIGSEVLIRALEERGMDCRIASYPEEGILLLDSHAQAWISGQQPAGNEIQPAPEKQRHQGQQLSQYSVLEVVAFFIGSAVVIVWPKGIVQDKVVNPQT